MSNGTTDEAKRLMQMQVQAADKAQRAYAIYRGNFIGDENNPLPPHWNNLDDGTRTAVVNIAYQVLREEAAMSSQIDARLSQLEIAAQEYLNRTEVLAKHIAALQTALQTKTAAPSNQGSGAEVNGAGIKH